MAPPVVVPEIQPVAPPPTIIVNVPPAPVTAVVTPVVAESTTVTLLDIGSCKMVNLKLTNVCKRMLDDAALRLENYPGAKIILTGPVEAGKAATYVANRASRSRIELRLSDEEDYTLTIQLYKGN